MGSRQLDKALPVVERDVDEGVTEGDATSSSTKGCRSWLALRPSMALRVLKRSFLWVPGSHCSKVNCKPAGGNRERLDWRR